MFLYSECTRVRRHAFPSISESSQVVVTCNDYIVFYISANQQKEQGLSPLSLLKIAISPLTLLNMVASPLKASTDQATHTSNNM